MEKNNLYFPNIRQEYKLTDMPVLQDSDVSDTVKELQQFLIELDFLRGVPNGIFGLTTKRAVELFQLTYKLPVTGIVDENTWRELEEALNNPLPTNKPTLKLGDQNVNVKHLAQSLIVLDYLDENANGLFDENIEIAVKDFQKARGLKVDGIVGPATWREIDRLFAAVEIDIPTLKPTIKEEDRNDYVKLLQNMLTRYGYYSGKVDGIFGRNTTNAVIKFQETYGLEANGIVDNSTWEVLDSLIRPEFIHAPILNEGSTAPEVVILQDKLKITDFFPGTVTGSFGPETTKALKKFQEANNLSATGVTDSETWKTLFQKTAIMHNGESQRQTPVSQRPVLRYGDNNEYVKELQKDLNQLMFYNGEIDGSFGQQTLDATKAFQTNNKLTADGVVGRHTWSELIYLYSPLTDCDEPAIPSEFADFVGVIIDAGHGGDDPGAIGPTITEKEYNLKTSQYMFNRLRELGVPVKMTRTTDEYLPPAARIARIKSLYGDVKGVVMLSNHLNAGGGEDMNVVNKLEYDIVCI